MFAGFFRFGNLVKRTIMHKIQVSDSESTISGIGSTVLA